MRCALQVEVTTTEETLTTMGVSSVGRRSMPYLFHTTLPTSQSALSPSARAVPYNAVSSLTQRRCPLQARTPRNATTAVTSPVTDPYDQPRDVDALLAPFHLPPCVVSCRASANSTALLSAGKNEFFQQRVLVYNFGGQVSPGQCMSCLHSCRLP
jgi:hypothetical protein